VSFAAVASLMWRRRLHQVRGEFALLLKERVRISREIHDTLLQSLIGVSLQLEQVEHDTDTSRAGKERLIRARKQVEEYIREARESIWNLRSSALEREGLGAALRHAGERAIAETHEGDGSAMLSFSVTGSPDRCAHDVEEQLLRIGQEAVTNATRHGRAQHIRMALSYADDAVILTVDDDGCGFDPLHSPTVNGTHWGLINMKERAVTVGGSFDISSTPGGGTRIVATVPRHPEAQPS
jgi:signal transduction histidine kinase